MLLFLLPFTLFLVLIYALGLLIISIEDPINKMLNECIGSTEFNNVRISLPTSSHRLPLPLPPSPFLFSLHSIFIAFPFIQMPYMELLDVAMHSRLAPAHLPKWITWQHRDAKPSEYHSVFVCFILYYII